MRKKRCDSRYGKCHCILPKDHPGDHMSPLPGKTTTDPTQMSRWPREGAKKAKPPSLEQSNDVAVSGVGANKKPRCKAIDSKGFRCELAVGHDADHLRKDGMYILSWNNPDAPRYKLVPESDLTEPASGMAAEIHKAVIRSVASELEAIRAAVTGNASDWRKLEERLKSAEDAIIARVKTFEELEKRLSVCVSEQNKTAARVTELGTQLQETHNVYAPKVTSLEFQTRKTVEKVAELIGRIAALEAKPAPEVCGAKSGAGDYRCILPKGHAGMHKAWLRILKAMNAAGLTIAPLPPAPQT